MKNAKRMEKQSVEMMSMLVEMENYIHKVVKEDRKLLEKLAKY